jgi:hypothetical protein
LFITVAVASTAFANIKIERIPIQNNPPMLLIRGEFEPSDDSQALLREALTTGAKIVTFDSNGGNILAAIAYGRVIRALGLSTFELRSAQCASACALAFMGGVVRKAEPGSIGVHQASFSDGAINGQAATAAVQSMTALIMSYLIEMGVDPRLLQLSLSVPSSDMRYLTTQEMDDYKVTTGGELELADVSTIAHPTPSAASAETSIKPAPPVPRSKLWPSWQNITLHGRSRTRKHSHSWTAPMQIRSRFTARWSAKPRFWQTSGNSQKDGQGALIV